MAHHSDLWHPASAKCQGAHLLRGRAARRVHLQHRVNQRPQPHRQPLQRRGDVRLEVALLDAPDGVLRLLGQAVACAQKTARPGQAMPSTAEQVMPRFTMLACSGSNVADNPQGPKLRRLVDRRKVDSCASSELLPETDSSEPEALRA